MSLLSKLKLGLARLRFTNSADYWDKRYRNGGSSTKWECYDTTAQFKANTLNAFVAEHRIESVIEFGCGDGRQLQLAHYPTYTGLDISPAAVELCRTRFAQDHTKQFYTVADFFDTPDSDRHSPSDLALSLDVLYHLVEETVFHEYLTRLFNSADRYVVIFSNDTDVTPDHCGPHIKRRQFTKWIATHQPAWKLIQKIPNPNPQKTVHFFIFEKTPIAKETPQLATATK